MKIIENNISPSAYVSRVKGKNKTSPTRLPSNIGIYRDRVELSPAAKEIRQAKMDMDSIPDVREEKVAEIKARIDNGTYTLDEEKIASKIIKEALLNDLS